MGYEHGKGANKRVSLVQGDEFFHRVISRDSSVGCSSHIYYYRNSEGVPFEWEMQPGTPKEPPKDEEIPPITPPPAVLSLGLPKPCINNEQPKAKAWLIMLRYWNKIKKNKERKSVKAVGSRGSSSHDTHDCGTEKFEFCGSDSEFMESSSSPRASSSSSSSSLSLSNDPSVQSARLENPEGKANSFHHGTLSCTPWSLSTILVSIARRV